LIAGAGAGDELSKLSQQALEIFKVLKDPETKYRDGMMKLRSGCSFPVEGVASVEGQKDPVGGNVLFHRRCNDDLLEIFEHHRLGLSGSRQRQGMIVIGRPGDGKSWAAMHFLWHYIQLGKTVVYDNVERDLVWVFRSDGVCRVERSTSAIAELAYSAAIHIHDAKAGQNQREPSVGRAAALLLSSSNRSSHAQFERTIVNKYGFTPPTDEEFYRIVRELVIDEEWAKLCDARYHRNVRLLTLGPLASEKLVRSAVDAWRPDIMMNVINDVGSDPANAHTPAVLLVPNISNEPLDLSSNERMTELENRYSLSNICWKWARPWVGTAVLEKHETSFMQWGERLVSGKARWEVAELVVSTMLGKGGKFDIRELKPLSENSANSSIEFKKMKVLNGPSLSLGVEETKDALICAKIDKVLATCMDFDCWYKVDAPLFDMFNPPNTFVNVTVNSKHLTNLQGAKHLAGKVENAKLYYAGPDDFFQNLKNLPCFGGAYARNIYGVKGQVSFEKLSPLDKKGLNGLKVFSLNYQPKSRHFSTSARLNPLPRAVLPLRACSWALNTTQLQVLRRLL